MTVQAHAGTCAEGHPNDKDSLLESPQFDEHSTQGACVGASLQADVAVIAPPGAAGILRPRNHVMTSAREAYRKKITGGSAKEPTRTRQERLPTMPAALSTQAAPEALPEPPSLLSAVAF